MGISKELEVLKKTTYEIANSLKNISDLLTNKHAVIKLEVSVNWNIYNFNAWPEILHFYHSTNYIEYLLSFPEISFLSFGAETNRSE